MKFAETYTDLIESMKSTCLGQPQLPAHLPTALDTFQMNWFSNLDDELWQFAGIESLFNYLRKHKKLRIPDEWKHVVPKALG